jgi:hypothetical protein
VVRPARFALPVAVPLEQVIFLRALLLLIESQFSSPLELKSLRIFCHPKQAAWLNHRPEFGSSSGYY